MNPFVPWNNSVTSSRSPEDWGASSGFGITGQISKLGLSQVHEEQESRCGYTFYDCYPFRRDAGLTLWQPRVICGASVEWGWKEGQLPVISTSRENAPTTAELVVALPLL